MVNVSIFVALLCSWLIPGLQCDHVGDEQYLTVLIDFEKYRHESIVRRRLTDGISTIRTISKECSDLEHGEYRMCGKKCVLNCRNDSIAGKFLISKEECDTNKCVEGCFCKDGFVRYHDKCVPMNKCPVRRNKAVDFVTEANTFDMKIQNSTQIASQMQASIISNQAQLDKDAGNPKIFGFLNRPGCGFLGCMPFSVQQQQYDESEERKDDGDDDDDSDRVYDYEKNRDPNRTPVHVHVHKDEKSSEMTPTKNKDSGKKGVHKTKTKDRDQSDESDESNEAKGGDGAVISGSFAAIPVAFPSFAVQNGIRDVPNFGIAGTVGNFPGFGNPANFPNLNNLPNFGGLQQNTMTAKDPVLSSVTGSNIHQILSSIGSPSINYNATTRTTTINYGLYSVTYNPNDTRTLHVFGLGTYTFRADGTIISSAVGPKISLPIEMGIVMPSPVANNNQEIYDNVEEDEENDIEEQQNNQSPHNHQNEEEGAKEVVEEEEAQEEDVQEESEEIYDPPKQSDKKDQSSATHYTNSPPPYPNPFQYPPFMNPNLPPYSMPHSGGLISPGFNPYNYYTASAPPPQPQTPPTNLQENDMVTQKPIKKKPVKNSNNKQTAPMENPNIENDSFVHIKPSKPNRKEKPTVSSNPNQLYITGQTYANGANPFLGQNQNIPFNPISPINSFNTNPFNNQFSIPFYSNSDTPFAHNYINPSNGFNSANDFPSQFGQTNPLNMYGNNNPYASKQYGATPSYQNNPNFNIPKTLNSPYGYNTVNQFNKFNGFPQYFANPSSNSN